MSDLWGCALMETCLKIFHEQLLVSHLASMWPGLNVIASGRVLETDQPGEAAKEILRGNDAVDPLAALTRC